MLQTIKRLKANWIGHILRRNCLLQRLIEENIEGSKEKTGRLGRRSKQLLDHLQEMRGYWNLQEEEFDCPLCITRFGRFYGPVVRQAT